MALIEVKYAIVLGKISP